MKNNQELAELIHRLLANQLFAVLATQFDAQPYCNLVAFAADGLGALLFVTSRDTRKYSNSLASQKVALLIDSRKNHASDFTDAIAITAVGIAGEVEVDDKDHSSSIYLSKHPQLEEFLLKPSNALMKVEVTEYIIATFKTVDHLTLGRAR